MVFKVPSTALLSLKYLLYAFALGADGVIMIEGRHDIDETFTKQRIRFLRDRLDDIGIDSMRLWYSLVELPSYKNIAKIFDLHTKTVEELGPVEEDAIEEIKEKLGI